MRTYETTHGWIKFELDLGRITPRLWMLLGEARSKCEHIAGVPLRPTTAHRLHRLYLAKGALATTAIEGNTLSEEEALLQLQGKLKLPPSREYLAREIDNIAEACDKIANDLVQHGASDISVETICTFNKLVLQGLSTDHDVIPGEIRTHSVGVIGIRYRGAPAEDCRYLLDRFCGWLNNQFPKLSDHEPDIASGLVKAIIAHLYIAWIHPFGDGNGRTARLLEFAILLSSGVPTPAAHLLSNFYNETRQEYYRQLARSSGSGGDVIPFISYAVEGFVDGLKTQLETIRDQQWDVVWRNYIHEKFRDMTKPSEIRRRHLALDISAQAQPFPMGQLKSVTPRIAEHYAKLSSKAIARDVKALVEMGLVEITKEGVRAKRETILSFLPYRRTS